MSFYALVVLLFTLLSLRSAHAAPMCADVFKINSNSATPLSESTDAQTVFLEKNFDQILIQLKKDAELNKMFSSMNEASKGITIERHVRDVFKQFIVERREAVLSYDFLQIMPIAIALHDIGKPYAIAKGERHMQHLYTVPMMTEIMQRKGYSKRQIKLAIALVDFTGLGDLAKGDKNAFQVALEVLDLAKELAVKPWDFYQAKKIFYMSDAGSYSQLRYHVFEQKSEGQLELKTERFLELEYWLKSQQD